MIAKRIALGLLLAGLSWGSAGAATYDAGTQSPFELGAGSRALALGGAYTAVADDVSALFWNPAGLARVDRIELSAMHINLFFDTPYDFIGAAYPLLDWGTFALGAVRLAADGINVRDASSNLIGVGNYDLREYLIGFGREILPGLAAGTTVRVDQQRLLGDFASGVGLDLGLWYHLPGKSFAAWTGVSAIHWDNLAFGVEAQNVIGSSLRLGEAMDVLPFNLRLGMAYPVDLAGDLQPRLLFAGAMEKSTWDVWHWHAGLEFSLRQMVALRLGADSDAWSAGAGLQYFGFALDYALTGQDLGLTHRFTLTYRFGASVADQRQDQEHKRQEEIDREAGRRAEAAVAHAKADMAKLLKSAERKYRLDRQALLASQLRQRRLEIEREYFKAFHYFMGIKDYLAKHYKMALVEFETVAKFDPKYLELPFYLGRCRQMASGEAYAMSPGNLNLYYRGIDLYLENRFAEAIATWQQILKTEPNNVMVLRNIEEAQSRVATITNAGTGAETEENAVPQAPDLNPAPAAESKPKP